MTNRYPGNCRKCGKRVPAGAGSASKLGGAWGVECSACSPIEAAPTADAGPLRILVTRIDSGAFRVAPSAYLADRFHAYREATAGMYYASSDKSQRTTDGQLLGRVLQALQERGFLLDVAPDVAVGLNAAAAQAAQEVASADARAAKVDEVLKARGLALYPFQRIGTSWMAPRQGALLGDDMGLGKTIQALIALPEDSPVLVIGPAVAKGVWSRECRRWRPDLSPVVLSGRGSFRWPAKGELVIVNYDVLPAVVDTKGKRKRHENAAGWWKNWSKAWAMIGEAAAAAHVLATCPDGVILVSDEAHALKGGNHTQRGARVKALAKEVRARRGRTWGLTATPLLNQPQELWNVLSAFGVEKEAYGSWNRFRDIAGGVEGRFGIEWEPDRMDEAALKAGLQRVMLRRMKTEVLKDLPAKTYRTIVVELPTKVAKLCDEALALIEARGQSVGEALDLATSSRRDDPAFEKMSKARAALATAKLEACIELIEEFEDANEPLVVFSAHRAPIDVLAKRPGWAAITGETPPAERTRIEEAFQAGHLRGVAGTIKAAGVAITLTRASNAIKIDKEWNPALNIQADDRIYRIGTSKPVTITSLVADHRLDERVEELLERKQAFLDKSVDAAARGAEEVPEAPAAVTIDYAAAAAQLAAAQVELEAEVARQRADWERRKATKAQHDAEVERERAEREKAQKEGKARAKAKRSLVNRTGVAEEELVDEPRRGPEGEREEWALRGLTYLASHDGDRALYENDVGFNRADGAVGHALAERVHEGLTPIEWKLAVVMLAKYHGQIGPLPGGPIDLLTRSAS